jgi:hypothetical protein
MTDILTRVAIIERVRMDTDHIVAVLSDGREVGIPLAWSDRLAAATPHQRAAYEIEDFGTSIHWPEVDEDIGLSTFLGVSEDVIYDALGWKRPSIPTRDDLRTAGTG